MVASKRILGWSLFAVAAIAVVGCGESGTTSSRAQKIKEPYPFTTAKRDIVGYTMLDKPLLYVPPESQAVVYPKYNAPVEQVMASVGQRVNRGEVLIQLSFPSADAAYEQAQADVKSAELAYEAARREYGQPLRDAQQALLQARKIERDQRTLAASTGDATGLEQARMQREAAEDSVAEAQNYLNANIMTAKSQVEAARAAMQEGKQGVKMGSLRAPISGTVTFLDVKAGDMVGDDARKPLVKIVDLADIKVKAYIPSDFSANLKKGDEVTLAFDEIPNRVFTGRLTKINVVPLAEGTGREITIDFKNEEGLIKEGFKPSWAGVKVGEVKNVIAVPNDAIANDATGKPTVNVLEAGKWLPRVVTLGMTDGKYTEIKSGLKEGETVQVTPVK